MADGRQLKQLGQLKFLRERFEALADTLETRTDPAERKQVLRVMKIVFDEIDEIMAYELASLGSESGGTIH